MTQQEGRYQFTSESVTEGHPDKICDQISDAILDAILADDPKGRVACECFTTTGTVIVGGEITTKTYVHIPKIVREMVREIGYTDVHCGFHWENIAVMTMIDNRRILHSEWTETALATRALCLAMHAQRPRN